MEWEPGQGHYPYQTPIDAYGNDGFRFADMSHRGSLLCLPSGMRAWEPHTPGEVTPAALSRALEAEIDVLLLGMGPDLAAPDPAVRAAFRDRGILLEAISTGSAVRTYNVLLAEGRAVGAALIAVEKARRR